MFKINSTGAQQQVSVNYDVYIPIEIKFGNWDTKQESTQYWRTGDFQNSLIEVGFGEKTKDLRSITLVMCHNVSHAPAEYPNLKQVLTGCPKVALTELSTASYIDEKGFLLVQIHKNSLSILLDMIQPSKVIKNNEIEFLLDKENTCIGLRIKNISANHMDIISDVFNCQD